MERNDIFDLLDNYEKKKDETLKKCGDLYHYEKDILCNIVSNGDFSTNIISWGGEREPTPYSQISIINLNKMAIYETNYKVYLGENGHLYLDKNDGNDIKRIKLCKRDKIPKIKYTKINGGK